MNFTEEERAMMRAMEGYRNYRIWMVKNAISNNIKHSEFHPDNIRKQIEDLQDLLKDSGE